mgnify:CR=1 FL=1
MIRPMRLFDPRLRAGDGVRPTDLRTLAWFGVEGLVLAPAQAPPAADWRSVLERLETVVGVNRRRVEDAGLQALCLVGVHPRWASAKGMHKVVHRLPELLRRPGVVGVGEVGLSQGTPPEVDLLQRHLEAAAEAELPAVIHVAEGEDRYDLIRLALDTVLASPLSPDRALLTAATPDVLELARAAGVRAGVTLGGCADGRAAGVAVLRTASYFQLIALIAASSTGSPMSLPSMSTRDWQPESTAQHSSGAAAQPVTTRLPGVMRAAPPTGA